MLSTRNTASNYPVSHGAFQRQERACFSLHWYPLCTTAGADSREPSRFCTTLNAGRDRGDFERQPRALTALPQLLRLSAARQRGSNTAEGLETAGGRTETVLLLFPSVSGERLR